MATQLKVRLPPAEEHCNRTVAYAHSSAMKHGFSSTISENQAFASGGARGLSGVPNGGGRVRVCMGAAKYWRL